MLIDTAPSVPLLIKEGEVLHINLSKQKRLLTLIIPNVLVGNVLDYFASQRGRWEAGEEKNIDLVLPPPL